MTCSRVLLAGVASLFALSAVAQTYPTKPIRIIVGFAPGGAVDIIARISAQRLSDSLGRLAVVENRPGASTNIAAELVAKAAPDGYTLLMGKSRPHLFPCRDEIRALLVTRDKVLFRRKAPGVA